MTDAPQRIQRRRTKGWRLPSGAIICTRPAKFGNPFKVGGWFKIGGHGGMRLVWSQRIIWKPEDIDGAVRGGYTLIETSQQAVDFYRRFLQINPLSAREIAELRGHDLACWCKIGAPCHADVLLEVVNA
jgi:hypothetical protein